MGIQLGKRWLEHDGVGWVVAESVTKRKRPGKKTGTTTRLNNPHYFAKLEHAVAWLVDLEAADASKETLDNLNALIKTTEKHLQNILEKHTKELTDQ